MSAVRIRGRDLLRILILLGAPALAGGLPQAQLQIVEPGFEVGTYTNCASFPTPEGYIVSDAACSPGGAWGEMVYMTVWRPADDNDGYVETLDAQGGGGALFIFLDIPKAMAFSTPVGLFGDVLCVYDERHSRISCIDQPQTSLRELHFIVRSMAFDPTGDFDGALFVDGTQANPPFDDGLFKLADPALPAVYLGPSPGSPLKIGPGGDWGTDLWAGSTIIDPGGGTSVFPLPIQAWDWAAPAAPWEGDMFARLPGSSDLYRVKPDGSATLFATGATGEIVFCLDSLWLLENENCRRVQVQQAPPVVVAPAEISPPVLTARGRGRRFTVTALPEDPQTGAALDPALLATAWISRVATPSLGEIALPVPRAEPGCDDATEDGIWENRLRREILDDGRVALVFDRPSDGLCLTMDGSRRDLLALLDGAARGEEATVCAMTSTPQRPGFLELCGTARFLDGRGHGEPEGLQHPAREGSKHTPGPRPREAGDAGDGGTQG